MNELARRVSELFTKKYKREPVLYFSPGRINLIGEHIDYNDGFVMPCAINKGVYYALAPNETESARFFSRDYDEGFEVELSAIAPDQEWKNYVLSVVHEIRKDGKVLQGFDCVLGGDIPVGAGLSSSAAVEGGLAFALNEMFDLGYTREQLAFLCQRAEHGFPQVNCGIMDQYANMMGKKNQAILLDCMTNTHKYLPLELGDYHIVLINTKVHHALAASAYNTRRSECETGLLFLQEEGAARSFRDIKESKSLDKYKNRMGESVWKRCVFVVDEIGRTEMAAKMLGQGHLTKFGELMFQSHEGLRDLYKVSCAELDFLVARAKDDPDVIGARMMGGGFGGCTINIVKSDGAKKFIETALGAYRKEFQHDAESYDVVTSDGTYRVE